MAINDWSNDEKTHSKVLYDRHWDLLDYVNKMNEGEGVADFFLAATHLGGKKYEIDGKVKNERTVAIERVKEYVERYNMIMSDLMKIEETLKNVAKQSLSEEEEIKVVNFLKYLLDSHGYRVDLVNGALFASKNCEKQRHLWENDIDYEIEYPFGRFSTRDLGLGGDGAVYFNHNVCK